MGLSYCDCTRDTQTVAQPGLFYMFILPSFLPVSKDLKVFLNVSLTLFRNKLSYIVTQRCQSVKYVCDHILDCERKPKNR